MSMTFKERFKSAYSVMFGRLAPYDATQWNRSRGNMPVRNEPAARIETSSRPTLASHANDLYRNSGMIRSILFNIEQGVVGNGFRLQCQSDDSKWNDQTEKRWTKWSRYATTDGKTSLQQFLRLVVRTAAIQGDCFILLYKQSGYPRLILVEGIACRNEGNEKKDEGFVDGIKLSKDGTPLAYKLWLGEEPQVFQAKDVVHFVDPTRATSTRGVSWISHGINSAFDISEILAAEKVAVKYASSLAAVRYTESGMPVSNSWDNVANANNGPTNLTMEQIFSGQIPTLAIGEKLETVRSDRPSESFKGFLQFILRDIAVGVGLPLEVIWDASQLGGTSQRYVLQTAQRRYEQIQQLLVDQVVSRIYGWVIAVMSKENEEQLPENWLTINFVMPPAITVDFRLQDQNRQDMVFGNRTLAEDCAEKGLDWQELRAQKVKEGINLVDSAKEIQKVHPQLSLDQAIMLVSQLPSQQLVIQQSGNSGNTKGTVE